MSDSPMSVSYMKLMLIFCFLSYTESRHVEKSGVFSGFVSRSSSDDLEVSAAEPRPVIIENNPEVLPLIADQNAFSDSTVSLASEKVEKILQRPLAFSYHNNDQSSAASEVEDGEQKQADVKEIDQNAAAIDYYKHLQTIESAEADVNVGNIQDAQSGDTQEKQGSEEVNAHSSDQESVKSGNDSTAEYSSEESESEQYGIHQSQGHKTGGENHSGGEGHSRGENISLSAGESHKEGGGHGSKEHSGGHRNGGGDGHEAAGGINDSYKKGGGQEHHSGHKGEKGEKGEKGYTGHHHDEKGEKGHHLKEKLSKVYEEKGGEKKEHHHNDGYNAEHEQGEKGEKGSKFQEYGDHSKGHSTKGEHNIHKKDEYEKKQEFYDESNEEDGFETDGDYFHEDDFSKGGFEKGSFHKGAEEEANHGKKHEHAKGGHYEEKSGYKDAKGRDVHHDQVDKYGEKENISGGKKWSHSKGTGGGGGGGGHGGGAHQHADETNAPIRIAKPDQISHSQNIVQLTLNTNKQNTEFPDVLYPPLTGPSLRFNEPIPPVQVKYEDDSPFMRILTPIQRRSDEINNEEDVKNQKNYEDKNVKLEQLKATISETNPDVVEINLQDHKIFLVKPLVEPDTIEEVYSKEESTVLREHEYDIKNPSEEMAKSFIEYKDLLSPISHQSSDEIGVYSIYKLGDYSSPKPLTEASIENQQIQYSEEVLSPSIEDNKTAISEDSFKQKIEAVSTSMKPIVVVEEEPYVI